MLAVDTASVIFIANLWFAFFSFSSPFFLHFCLADAVTYKGAVAFQYQEYLTELAKSSYASMLPSCDLSASGLLNQGLAVQHVLCRGQDVFDRLVAGDCPEVCQVLVDYQGAACIKEVGEAEAQIANDFRSAGGDPSEELLQLVAKVSGYLNNEYISAEELLKDEPRLNAVLDAAAVPAEATIVAEACG
jgi:hypothetical protein